MFREAETNKDGQREVHKKGRETYRWTERRNKRQKVVKKGRKTYRLGEVQTGGETDRETETCSQTDRQT